MTPGVQVALTIFALICMVVGASLSYYALRRYGSAAAPKGVSFNPKNWRLVYLTRDWFTEKKGFWLFIIGIEILCGGPLVLIIAEAVYR